MAVFDADKDITPGIVCSVPFFGGVLALLMIGGSRHSFTVSVSVSQICAYFEFLHSVMDI